MGLILLLYIQRKSKSFLVLLKGVLIREDSQSKLTFVQSALPKRHQCTVELYCHFSSKLLMVEESLYYKRNPFSILPNSVVFDIKKLHLYPKAHGNF